MRNSLNTILAVFDSLTSLDSEPSRIFEHCISQTSPDTLGDAHEDSSRSRSNGLPH